MSTDFSFWAVDAVSAYLYALKFIAIPVALIILVSSLDDAFIDIGYWVRRVWRSQTVYKQHARLHYEALNLAAEKPLVIMIPAWHEAGVIGRMVQRAVTTLEYENYHLFIGCYPNDHETQAALDGASAGFQNVHTVICSRPGPTTKADCLNNILDAVLQFERQASFEFAGFILHDSEDVLSTMQLKLFNHLVSQNDLIQVPVYPYERSWTHFTSMHYLDEFAEFHGKDIPVREALSGQVPSAGVGTCFSRRALLALILEGDGLAFDLRSLTEDYDIAIRLKKRGMREIFVRFPVIRVGEMDDTGPRRAGQEQRDRYVICVREYFPDNLRDAVRQKARWIVGVVYQGYLSHGWTRDWVLNYFLLRDRKGTVTNFVSFAATLILLQLTLLLCYELLWPGAYHFLSIFSEDAWLTTLLWINFFLMSNRMLQRFYFVSAHYGARQGALSIPRILWANFINFLANVKAISMMMRLHLGQAVPWVKTDHDFPTLGLETHGRKMIGQWLIEQGAITETQLEAALRERSTGLMIGSWLIHQNVISSEQLARALAAQARLTAESIDSYSISSELIAQFPASLALHHAAIPVREEHGHLVLASESKIDPVSLGAISRRLKRPIKVVLAWHGQVTVGLRHWYARHRVEDPRDELLVAVKSGQLSQEDARLIWDEFVSRQFLFAEVLCSLGRLDVTALRALLQRTAESELDLGAELVESGLITEETLRQALALQRTLQPSISELISAKSLSEEQQEVPS